jgi:hypothetical protein
MVQSAHRFSELSRTCPQIVGLVIDDFWANYEQRRFSLAQVGDIKDALHGKVVRADGTIDPATPETTPELKLYVVLYEGELGPRSQDVMDVIDGVSFWMLRQDAEYTQFDTYMNAVTSRYAGKGILIGDYLHNGIDNHGDMSPASVYATLERALDLYDAGTVAGISIYTGHWMSTQWIPRTRWDALALPAELDRVYYPYLGEAELQVVDATGALVEGALVTVTDTRPGGDLAFVTRKLTGAKGSIRFGAWAGKTSAGPQYHVTAQKDGATGEADVQLEQRAVVFPPPIALAK